MPIVIGVTLAIAVALFARVTGLDRDRAFYPVVTIVVASLYLLFAVLGGGGSILLVELVGAIVFIAAALAGHGLFDAVHHRLIANPGVPEWWPPFCASYDLAAGAILAVLILADRRAGVSGSVARSA